MAKRKKFPWFWLLLIGLPLLNGVFERISSETDSASSSVTSTASATPALTVTSCQRNGAVLAITVSNRTAKRYDGSYMIGLFSEESTDQMIICFKPYQYYEGIDQHSDRSHTYNLVLPGGMSETCYYVLNEDEQSYLDEAWQNGEAVYAAYWAGKSTEPDYCPVTLASKDAVTMPAVTRASGVAVQIKPSTQTESTLQ